MRTKNFTILVIDDNPDDQMFITKAFRRNGVTNPIHCVESGDEAIAYLKGEGKYTDRFRFAYPSFITTDLKMACGDGLLVLEHLRTKPDWAVIPTAVLSGSRDLDDIKTAYNLGASSYHIKPVATDDLNNLVRILYDYWMTCEVLQVDSSGKQLPTVSSGKMSERYRLAQ